MRIVLCLLLLCVTVRAVPQPLKEADFENPAWLKETADGLAACVGTFRGAAFAVRRDGREESAKFLEDSARGALVSAQYLLTARAALENKVLSAKDSAAYIEGVASGSEGRFKALAEAPAESQSEMAAAMQACADLNAIQTAIVQAIRESLTLGQASRSQP